MEIPTIKVIKPNFTQVYIGNTRFWFSYVTCIAVENENGLTIRKNVWGPTTGKHLNIVHPDKSIRVCQEEFEALLQGLKNENILN